MRCVELSGSLGLKMLHDVANGLNLLRLFIADFAAELLFKRHYQFNQVQTVSIQVFLELGIFCHLVWINIQLIHNNVSNLLKGCCHTLPPCSTF